MNSPIQVTERFDIEINPDYVYDFEIIRNRIIEVYGSMFGVAIEVTAIGSGGTNWEIAIRYATKATYLSAAERKRSEPEVTALWRQLDSLATRPVRGQTQFNSQEVA